MYLNPQQFINDGSIKFPEWMDDDFKQKCIQPNALDITLDKAFSFDFGEYFILTENIKQMRQTTECPVNIYGNQIEPTFRIPVGVTDIMSDFHITVPAGVAAFIIVRSTLNRNGLYITSGLYDQGFDNNIGFALHNRGEVAYIAPRTRVAQLVLVKSEDSGMMYGGLYNSNKGQHWSTVSKH
jgi:deoxycytidine triphosphate deaminase